MKVSWNWLKTMAPVDLTPEQMAHILTETGLEVDGIEKIESVKGGLEGVFIGQVLTCTQHPDADKLKVTTVSIGGEPLQIVCGAPNVAVGQKVIVATVGCTLYPKPDEPFKIKLSKIRGVESHGMLCAEDELGLGSSHDGILVLPDDTPVGIGAAAYFELEDDYQLEIGLTPNRADAMGHIGVARDLLAYVNFHENKNIKLKWPEITPLLATASKPVSIEINTGACSRYAGVSISGVKIQASPAWMQKKLRAIGLSPINNVVDCTNYVMRELGTPLHAFDADKLGGGVIVQQAKGGEKFTTLDGVERVLHESDMMISSNTEHLAMAGVFGGLKSGISSETTEVFLESAWFDPVSVRKTARRHGLSTDASFRFERGVDPALTRFALERVTNLIIETAGGAIAMDVLDVYPQKMANLEINFRPSFANRLIGANISNSEMRQIFESLDVTIQQEQEDQWLLSVPRYRVDVIREVDLVEELLRIYSFNRVALPTKLNMSIPVFPKPDTGKIQEMISAQLVAQGFSEMMNNSLSSATYHDQLLPTGKPEQVELLNPLSQDLSVLRQSLLFGALESLAHNHNRQQLDTRLFEFGTVYHKRDEKYMENKRLMIVLSGRRAEEQWNTDNNKVSFFTIKGIVMSLFQKLGITSQLQEEDLQNQLFEDGISFSVLKQSLGNIGWLNVRIRKQFGIKNDVFVADLNWDALLNAIKVNKVVFSELPKTFEMRRDFSLLLDQQVTYASIEKLARQTDRKLLKRTSLFDVYEGDKLEAGKKSYAVAFYFQDQEQTLKDEVVDQAMHRIRTELEAKLGAQLR